MDVLLQVKIGNSLPLSDLTIDYRVPLSAIHWINIEEF